MPDDCDKDCAIAIGEPNDYSRIEGTDNDVSEASEKRHQDLISQDVPASPNQHVREALVATAAKFLQTSKVVGSDTSTKQLFLRKKGLTPLEIQEAFSRAGLNYEEGVNFDTDAGPPATVPQWQLNPPAPYHSQLGAGQVTYPLQAAIPTLWQRLKDFCNLVLFVTGAAYGAHYSYLHVIRPWLTGRRPPEPLELQVARLQAAVADSLVQLKTSVAALQRAVQGYTAVAKSCPTCGSDPSSSSTSSSLGEQLQQVKTELTSLKSLMLNRRSFMPTPSLAPSIPSWQRSNGVKDSDATVTNSNRVNVTPVNTETLSSNVAASVLTAGGSIFSDTDKSTSSRPGGDLVSNGTEKVNSGGGLMPVARNESDSVKIIMGEPVVNDDALPLPHSSDSPQSLLSDESPARSSFSEGITSSQSVTSDVTVCPDRPDRTPSNDSTVFSDALDSGSMNGIGNGDLDTSDSVASP